MTLEVNMCNIFYEMPANLTPDYLEAEKRFREARTTEEKIAALQEMLALLPKHKGTEKIFADLKAKLAKLRRGEEKKGGPARKGSEYFIRPEGAGQVVLIGAPNAGKSALLRALTNAEVEVTDYPFSTRRPVPGMMAFEDVSFQLVDTPSISQDYLDPFLPPLIRNADAAALCIDLSAPDCLDQPQALLSVLEAQRIVLVGDLVSRSSRQGSPRRLPAILVLTKADHPDAPVAMELLKELLPQGLKAVPVAVTDASSLDSFRKAIFDLFGLIRVYSKRPGHPPDMTAPYLLPLGSTVLDFAEKVHRSFVERFGYARAFGPSRIEGQRLGRSDLLQDKDIIELHMA